MTRTHNGEQCEICEAGSQYAWRVTDLEKRMKALEEKLDKINSLLVGTLATGTLSVILLLVNLYLKEVK